MQQTAGNAFAAELKLPAARCGESSILERNDSRRLCSLTPRRAAGNALAADSASGGLNTWIDQITSEIWR